MTETAELLGARPAPQVRVVGAVSAAHFVSHYYIILLAPLLPFVRADYGVSYTEIGLAFAIFNTVSAVLQAPAGFLVDRLGARLPLISALVLGASAFLVVGLTSSYWLLIAMFAVAGTANAVYHPADYALLSQHVPAKRIGPAFSFHTFAGIAGSAAAPPTLLIMQQLWGWRGAFIGASVLGFAVAAALIGVGDPGPAQAAPRVKNDSDPGWRILLSPAILLNLVFFVLLAITSGGIYNYSVVALASLYGTPVASANAALTGYLVLSALGVLAGGALAGRTSRHGLVAAVGLLATAALTALVGGIDLGAFGTIAAMAAAGFFSGMIMPSRDMIVREVTPPGSFGKVFGFVTTGFNIGGIIAPLIFGAIMDQDLPRLVFLGGAAGSLIAIATVATRAKAR
ncbi:MAG TPA: MFS transporter [Pseudolabrys sp.]|nr:MFS transporter [Pseudolabrys sp.]